MSARCFATTSSAAEVDAVGVAVDALVVMEAVMEAMMRVLK
jgi:hypothetical protein